MKTIPFVVAVVVFGLSSCKKIQDITASPNSSFNTNIITGHDPLEKEAIQLTNNSSENCNYFWDFGNGTSSIEKNPSVSYKMHGNYTITLSVTDKNGLTSSSSQNVSVLCKYRGGDHQSEEIL